MVISSMTPCMTILYNKDVTFFSGDQLTMKNVKENITAITNTRNTERYVDQALAFANSQMFTKENGMRDDPGISRVKWKYIFSHFINMQEICRIRN